MKKRKTLNTLACIIIALGVFLLLGTFGAAEQNLITAAWAVMQGLISAGILVVGVRLFAATYEPTDYDYEEDEEDYYE
jgi:hypothetical protein